MCRGGERHKPMISIQKSKTADTRTCDPSKVTRAQLQASSVQHIGDVRKALDVFKDMLELAGIEHDKDKLTGMDQFHSDFVGGFKSTMWLENHKRVTRHHLQLDGVVPRDVNLIDVLEMVADCVMAGLGRSGKVYPMKISPDLLQKAFDNTVELLTKQVKVENE